MSKEGASDGATAGRVANVSEWIAHAIVDCGVTLVFGTCFSLKMKGV
jgi:hypothetical protein